ncbi:MAG: hypothetical protein IPN20_05840 [Haliscomenobacter sp.]|nr:hypothetical protein [Haliscomenobacter sp.]
MNGMIDYLILWKNRNHLASEEEKRQLEEWLSENSLHRSYYRNLTQMKTADFHLTVSTGEVEKRLALFFDRIGHNGRRWFLEIKAWNKQARRKKST